MRAALAVCCCCGAGACAGGQRGAHTAAVVAPIASAGGAARGHLDGIAYADVTVRDDHGHAAPRHTDFRRWREGLVPWTPRCPAATTPWISSRDGGYEAVALCVADAPGAAPIAGVRVHTRLDRRPSLLARLLFGPAGEPLDFICGGPWYWRGEASLALAVPGHAVDGVTRRVRLDVDLPATWTGGLPECSPGATAQLRVHIELGLPP